MPASGGPNLQGTNRLITFDVTSLARGTTINTRERDIINLSGVRLRMSFKNTISKPLYLNMCLLSPKENSTYSNAATWETAPLFRNLGGAQRTVQFNDITLNGIARHTFPLNTDRFAVLWHFRTQMGATGGNTVGGYSTGAGGPRSYRTLSRYIKLKRGVRYLSDLPNQAENPVWLLIWCNEIDEVAGFGSTVNALEWFGWGEIYFRDPGK